MVITAKINAQPGESLLEEYLGANNAAAERDAVDPFTGFCRRRMGRSDHQAVGLYQTAKI